MSVLFSFALAVVAGTVLTILGLPLPVTIVLSLLILTALQRLFR